MAWLYLLAAGLFEIGWAVGLRHSDGFSRLWPSCWTLVCMLASLVLLELALRELPLGSAYAVWVGIGIVGSLIAGILLWQEPVGLLRLASVGFIVLGIVGVKVSSV